MNNLELKVPPPVLALIFFAIIWFASWQLPSLAFEMPGSHYWGIGLAGTGIILALAGVIEFRKAETTINPTKPGVTLAMVTSGVYRLSRNPVLSHVLAFLYLPVFVAYLNRFQITPEERVLSVKFGEAFAAYTQAVRKWL
jgi:protein-S-isoprenylcysteine O-methyltransferase Ste14